MGSSKRVIRISGSVRSEPLIFCYVLKNSDNRDMIKKMTERSGDRKHRFSAGHSLQVQGKARESL